MEESERSPLGEAQIPSHITKNRIYNTRLDLEKHPMQTICIAPVGAPAHSRHLRDRILEIEKNEKICFYGKMPQIRYHCFSDEHGVIDQNRQISVRNHGQS